MTRLWALAGAVFVALVVAGFIAVVLGGWLAEWKRSRAWAKQRPEAVSVRELVRR